MKKTNKKNQIIKLLFSAFVFFGGSTLLIENTNDLSTLEKSSEPVIYSSQCKDNVRGVLCNSIKKAKNNIFVKIYNLSDDWIINTLTQKSLEKVPVKLHYYHLKNENNITSKYPLIETSPFPASLYKNTLMHIKATVVDDSIVWLGSANYTHDSLNLDSNLTIGIRSHELSKLVTTNTSGSCFVNDKKIDYYVFPEDTEKGSAQILSLIKEAKQSIKIGMFALTEPSLLKALCDAYERGIHLQIIIDKSYSSLTKKILSEECGARNLPICVKTTKYKLHHKFAWIDDSTLISGSANWSRNGFHNNIENILIIYDLSEEQNKKMSSIWNRLSLHKRPLEEYLQSVQTPIDTMLPNGKGKKSILKNLDIPILSPSLSFLENYYSDNAA